MTECFWCGHRPHTEGVACGEPTHILKTPCECRARQEQRCAECGRRVDVVEGTALHRLPRPEQLPIGEAGRRWGTELALFTMATIEHKARVA